MCAEELTKKLDELEERAEDLDKKRNAKQSFSAVSSLGFRKNHEHIQKSHPKNIYEKAIKH